MLSRRNTKGNITTAHQVNAGLATYRALLEQRGKISAYCNLAVSANTRDKEAQTRCSNTYSVSRIRCKIKFL